MARLNPRRLTGAMLRIGARADRLPLLGAGIRAVGAPLLGMQVLRDADLGSTVPWLIPDDLSGPPPGPRSPGTDAS